MEDEAQKMVALKKAYAEIILNTAKEAAARVMTSERKALRFQQDLRFTKDEALRVLLRLKQMIDSKTSEAEITSLSQQRRIEELEAQLQEAEDIITDLRSELKQVWSELQRVNNNHVKPTDGQVTKEDASFPQNPTPEPIILSTLSSGHETNPTSGLKSTAVNKCCNEMKQSEQLSVSDLDTFCAPDADLASIIMRTKEPELLRNGCTQRIRAFERNLLDEKLLPSGYVDNHNSNRKDGLAIKASDMEEGNCNSPSFRGSSMEVVNNPSETKEAAKVRTVRRRKSRFGKAKTLCRSRPSELLKSHCRTYSADGNDKSREDACILPPIKANNIDMTRTSSGLEESLQHSTCNHMDQLKTICNGKGKRKMKRKDGITTSLTSTGQLTKPDQPSPVLSRCRTFAYLCNGGVQSFEDGPKTTDNEAKMKSLPRLDPGLTLIRSDHISGSTSATVSMKGINKSGAVQNAADKDLELIDVPVMLMQESDAVDNIEASSSKFDVPVMIMQESDTVENSEAPSSKVDVPVMLMQESEAVENSEASSSKFDLGTAAVPLTLSESKDVKASEQSNGLSRRADNRLLKYTFQRKRKNTSSNHAQTASFEENASKRRIEGKECTEQQPEMKNESSRDSRRLAQVARQLISLSGQKWC